MSVDAPGAPPARSTPRPGRATQRPRPGRTAQPPGGRRAARPSDSALRRALARARDGKALDQAEAAILLHARGEQLTDLLSYASRARDAGPGGGRPARRHHLLAQGLHPADPAVPGPLRLLHLRHRARPAGQPLPVAGRGPRDRAAGRRAGLQGGPVHPGRPARGPLAPGPRVAGRARLRRHAVLRPGDGDRGARGDRPAAAPQPRRAELAGLPAAQAGRAVDGDDAGDHRGAAVHRAGRRRISAARTRTRRSGCGCWRTPAAATSRSPPGS